MVEEQKNDALNVETREDADIGAVEKSRVGTAARVGAAAARVGGRVGGRVAIKKGRFHRDSNPGWEDQNLQC